MAVNTGIPRSSALARAFVTLSLAAALLPAQSQGLAAPSAVLNLSASASQEVPKDLFSVVFSTQKEGSDAAAVQVQLKVALDAALAEARRSARPGQLEVQTGAFGLGPRYASKGGISGWQGHAELLVEGRDATAVAALVGRIQTLTVARVGWSLSREAREKAEADVAAQAIARWRQKAEAHVKSFGQAGYVIREVSVSGGDQPVHSPMPMARAQMANVASSGMVEGLPTEGGKALVSISVSGSVQMK